MKVIKQGELVKVSLETSEQSLPLDKLWELLKTQGYQVCRTTAWRAKARGWFCADYNPGDIGERVYLTEEQKELSARALSEMTGLSGQAAKAAKERGWFQIIKGNKGKVFLPEVVEAKFKLPDTLFLTEAEKKLPVKELMARFGLGSHTARDLRKRGRLMVRRNVREHARMPEDRSVAPRFLLPEKVKLTPGEKKLSATALADRFGIRRETAHNAKKRGYFMVTANNRNSVRIPVNRLVREEEVKQPVPKTRFKSRRVILLQEELQMTPRQLAHATGINESTARAALKRGYFVATAANIDSLLVDRVRLTPLRAKKK